MSAMHWIRAHLHLAPFPGRFTRVRFIGRDDPGRKDVEAFIAEVYWFRYGARLRSFQPNLLAYYDGHGHLAAVVGLRSGDEGPLFAEQYLDEPVEQVLAQRGVAAVDRARVVEVGNFAAVTAGAARELILQMACMLRAADRHWVLFVATRQLRNAFQRLHLSPIDLAGASVDRLCDPDNDWGRYYASGPRLMCGEVANGILSKRGDAALVESTTFQSRCAAVSP